MGDVGQGGAEPVGEGTVHARPALAVEEQAVVKDTVCDVMVEVSEFELEKR